jgi:predicted ester cyclase
MGLIFHTHGLSERKQMPSLQQNKNTVAEFIEIVWRQGRLDELPTFWTVDCVNHADPSGGHGLGSLHAYHAGFSQVMSSLSDVSIAVERQIAESDLVTTQMLMTSRHTGELFGMPPTGKLVTLTTIRIDRLVDGKIAEHWSVADMFGLMQQLRT